MRVTIPSREKVRVPLKGASISGVNQNQQEVDILSAQNAFQAASQAIDAINQSFQSLLQAV